MTLRRALLRPLIALALVAPLATPAAADPRPQAAATAAPAPALRPALWKLADTDTTIWLFGTVHVLAKDQQWFAGPVASAADGSDELVTEIGDVAPEAVVPVVMALGFLPEGQSLRALLGPADRTAFEAALTRLKLPLDAFDRCEPWYAANALLLTQLRAAGIVGDHGPEALLADRFKARARPRVPLETIEYQLGLFDALPQPVQLAYLREVVTMGADAVDQVRQITAQWGRGDSEGLAATVNAMGDDPVMVERLLIERNKTWSRWLQARLDRPGTVFVAVGAGHLAGKGSVQDQLATLGLKVTRVQ